MYCFDLQNGRRGLTAAVLWRVAKGRLCGFASVAPLTPQTAPEVIGETSRVTHWLIALVGSVY